MKQILIIANYKGPIGGISGQVEELYRHLREDGRSVDIFSTVGNPIRRLVAFFRLLFIARHYDVLHIHGCSYRGMLPVVYGVIAGKCWRKRIFITYHGGDADRYFASHIRFVKRWLMSADQRIVLSGFLRSIFDKYGIPCIVIPNIVTLSAPVSSIPSELGHPYRFISVRHLRDLYNIPCILRAFRYVKSVHPEAVLTVLGQGPLRHDLEQWVADNHVPDVSFVGQVPNDRMMRYLADADIMLSAPHIDNMPVSVLEAMNAGVLVISSRVGGVPYMIRELQPLSSNCAQADGLLFADADADELARKMIWAMEHPDEVKLLAANAQQEVLRYRWENIRDSLMSVYAI